MKRLLRLEALEPRHLMAGDFMPFHNYLVPNDVNGDFSITPLDALVVINRLNMEGSGPLAGKESSKDNASFVDTDGDNSLSPLDALRVINALNNGEGAGELAEVRYKFFSVNLDGTAGAELPDSNPSNTQPDAVISTGQKIIVRTQMTDLRRTSTPRGVFSAYHDLTYTNADSTPSEKLQLQWGEFNQLDIKNNARLGNFTIKYGNDTTAPISLATVNGFPDSVATAVNIKNAIEALPSVGAGNVKVSTLNSNTSFSFGISFVGALARTDFVNPTIGSNNFDASNGAVTVDITGQTNPSPTQDTVARIARNHNLDNGTFDSGTGPTAITRYINGPSGVLVQPANPASRTLTLLGGFSNSSQFLDASVATRFLNVVDVLFIGGSEGKIDLVGTVSPPPGAGQSGNNLGIALFGEDGGRAAYLTSDVVVLPKGSITIANRLTAVGDSATIAEDSAQTSINVLANDIDLFGTTRSIVSVGTSTAGAVSFSSPNVTFTPNKDFNGTATFTYTVQNDKGDSAVGTVTITITPVNDPPVVIATPFQVSVGTPLVITPLQIFSPGGPADEAGQAITLSNIVMSVDTHGTVTLVGANINFTPAPNFNGIATFSVTGTDTGTASDPAKSTVATITVNVTNSPPVAVNDTGDAARFVVLGIAAPNPLDVMRNDNAGPNEPNDTITVVSVTAPTIGTAVVGAGGTRVIFTPPTGSFNVSSTFSYTIRDSGGLESTANVEVFIIPPVLPFALTDTPSTPEDSGAFTIDVIANDFANTGATKRLESFGQPGAGTGTVTLDNRGTPNDKTDDRLIYTPPANFFGDAIFTYTMTDSAAGSAPSTATVIVTVTPLNDPPTAADRTAAGTEDIVLTVTGATITNGLSKGPGEDAQTLTVTDAVIVSPNNSGTVAVVGGDIQFSPAKDFNGQVLIRYTVTDNGLNNTTPAPLSASATLTINIAPVNDPPVANADPEIVTSENKAATITIASRITNDTAGPANETGQTPSFVALVGAINSANGGTVTQVGTNLIYTPATSYNGPDTFTYQISDSQATNSTTTATATIRVTEVNDPPRPTTITRSDNVFASVPTVFNVSAELASMPRGPANESGQTLRIKSVGTPTKGTVVLNADGTLTYTAPIGASGRDSFTYVVEDNGTTNGVAAPLTATGTFNVDISPFIPSSVRGVVYIDDNDSGTIDPFELKIGGVAVTLTTAATVSAPSKTTTKLTLADGSYAFDVLPPGSYTVSYAIPYLMDDGRGPNSFTTVIVPPGNINSVNNFAVLGVKGAYGNLLEYVTSGFDNSSPRNRNAGVLAAIGPSGRTEWTIARTSFEGDTFEEVVLSNDGTQAYLTAVRGADHSIYTATLTRRQFAVIADPTGGGRLVRVMARSEDLVWQKVSLAAPPVEITSKSKTYQDTIHEVFAQQSWMEPKLPAI